MRKNAFTLIELLAVIVILAIIALIAVPVVLNIINDSKVSSKKESIKMYGKAMETAIGNYFVKNSKEVTVTLDKVKELVKYNGEKIECKIERIGENGNVYLSECTVGGVPVDFEYGKYVPETISLDKSYVGYYADTDGDGKADGIIYADLAFSKQGTYSYASYSYESKDNLKEYTISKEKYDGDFGSNEIITAKRRNTGNERFYVLALSNFSGAGGLGNGVFFYWYKNAQGKMSTWNTNTSKDFGAGYKNTGNMIEIWNKNGDGVGSYIGASQDSADVWKYIQSEYKKGWYIPSLGEWDAFYDYSPIKRFGTFWSSSQENENYVWIVGLGFGYTNPHNSNSLRLGKTF